MILLTANGGHRITDEGNVAPTFCCENGPYDDGIDMDTVENDASRETLLGESHTYNAWFASAHRGHCIEEVRNAT
jgi:hypothetical protein